MFDINITYNNNIYCLKDLAEIIDIDYNVLWNRLKRLNWSVDKALIK